MPGNRMRNPRPHNRNLNSNQGFGSSGRASMAASSGPLMTNHLQLHDLDLELALLKRKREMIEKQHTMLVSESRFGGSNQYGFNQASQSYGQRSEPTRNFSNFYNDGPGTQYDRFNTQQGVKRPAIDPWDNSPPKRFNASSGPKKTPSRYEPRPARSQPVNQPPPLMSSSFRQRRSAPVATRTNFRPTKVIKPRQNTVPNKLNSYPVAERKNLVNKASSLVQKTPEKLVYDGDKPANPKLLGRLELALGTILREIREQYGAVEPYAMMFLNVSGQRAVKQAIRERIRTLMLGKPVGAGAEIVALYRKEHPKETDVELLDKARESIVQIKGNLAIDIIKQGNPEKYFRINFKRLLHSSLEEMFDRVQKLYTNVDTSNKTLQEEIDSMLVDIEKALQETKVDFEAKPEENAKNDNNQSAENMETENSDCNTDKNDIQEDTNAASEEPEVKSDANPANEDNAGKTEENAANPDENAVQTEEKTAETEEAANPAQNGDASVENAESHKKVRHVTSDDEFVRARFYNRLMESLMKRHLPLALPRYKEFMLRIIGTDSAFKETKAYLIKTTNEKVDETKNTPTTTPTKAHAGSTEKKSLFVRVMGRPVLPKKKLMKSFLDNFHPTLIKKHRNMHNVLFVSFDSEENFNNILAENGTTIASCCLDIKVSERINKNKAAGTENVAYNDDQLETKTEDNDVELVETKTNEPINLDENLDNQINDLLSSIREEEDKKGDEPETGVKEQPEEEVKEENANNDGEIQEPQNGEPEASEIEEIKEENDDKNAENDDKNSENDEKNTEVVQEDVETAKAETPVKNTRSSARLTSTPSTIRTRRTSKLPQNN